MLKVDRKLFEKVVLQIVESKDIEGLTREFSLHRVFFYSLLNDISKGKLSLNYPVLEKIAGDKNIDRELIIHRAQRVLSYLAPDEGEDDSAKRVPALPVIVSSPWMEIGSGKFIYLFPLVLAVFVLAFYLLEWGLPFRSGETGEDKFSKKVERSGDSSQTLLNKPTDFAREVESQTGSPKEEPLSGIESDKQAVSSLSENVEGAVVKEAKKDEELKKSSPLRLRSGQGPGETAKIPTKEKLLTAGPQKDKDRTVVALSSLPKEVKKVPAINEAVVAKVSEKKDKTIIQPKGETESVKEKPTRTRSKTSESTRIQTSGENKKVAVIAEGGKYAVQEGDNLWRVATRFGTSVKSLKAANNLKEDKIRTGSVLIIPNGIERPEVVKEEVDEGKSVPVKIEEPGVNRYVVQKGDNLSNIASSFDVSVESLKAVNNLEGSVLKVGKVLVIPPVERQEETLDKQVQTEPELEYVIKVIKEADGLKQKKRQVFIEQVKRPRREVESGNLQKTASDLPTAFKDGEEPESIKAENPDVTAPDKKEQVETGKEERGDAKTAVAPVPDSQNEELEQQEAVREEIPKQENIPVEKQEKARVESDSAVSPQDGQTKTTDETQVEDIRNLRNELWNSNRNILGPD